MIKVNLLDKHMCKGPLPRKGAGYSINICIQYKNGEMWMVDTSGLTQVNYCPYCGKEALVKVGE